MKGTRPLDNHEIRKVSECIVEKMIQKRNQWHTSMRMPMAIYTYPVTGAVIPYLWCNSQMLFFI